MKTLSDRSIEGQKLFPVFAWAILLMFSGFVYLLTVQLQKVSQSLVTTATINAMTFETIKTVAPEAAIAVSAE